MPGGEALTVTLRSPGAPAGGSLLEPENRAWVSAEGANPFRKERRDHSEVMLIRPQQAQESSTNASSVCWNAQTLKTTIVSVIRGQETTATIRTRTKRHLEKDSIVPDLLF